MGLGGVLMQNGQVVAYASRKLKILRHYLFGSRFGGVQRSQEPEANVVADALSRKSLHVSMLMVRELELIEQFRNMSLVCGETPNSVKLSMLKLTSDILEEIKKGQKSDLGLVDCLMLINQGNKGDFRVDENDVVRFRDRVCIPDVPEIKKSILEEGHGSGLSIHPEWKWDNIFMDFGTGLPKTSKGCASIWVIVDRLTKSDHFIPMRINYSLQKLARLYINEIMKLHGIPSSIGSDRDPRFTSRFWEILHTTLGTKLRLSSAYYP
ncbi:uncharacterized protein LOC127123931 [Lathyrus oleraceus]|uniref:uncharacterized protein LOC127123931 n=1 Tax=Pisum sativum TaxID=3888 RepID=UPI0021D2D524|nr:uncharacterized protein LOC127123931 [Pisum sativum]